MLAGSASAQGVTCALVFDGSKSLGEDFASVKRAGREVITRLRDGDTCMVSRFVTSDEIRVIQDFSGDHEMLLGSLDRLHTDLGQSAVVDAVYVTAKELSGRKGTGKPALIIVTDGEDRASYYGRRQLLDMLRATGVRVYAVGFTARLKKGAKSKAEKLLAEVAEASGGRAFFVASREELPGIAASIDEAMRR
jgi:Ca-activated chloride channel family protein